MVFASSPIRQPLKCSTYRMIDPARRARLYLELKRIIRYTYIRAKTHATARRTATPHTAERYHTVKNIQ
jgi:hypothetical protein